MNDFYTDIVKATVSSKGQVVIPKEIRKTMGIHSGDEITFKLSKSGRCEVESSGKHISRLFGFFEEEAEYTAPGRDINEDIMRAVSENDRRSRGRKSKGRKTRKIRKR